jgi:hypothetical protein
MKAQRVVLALLLTICVTAGASALPIYDDPVAIKLLQTIKQILTTVQEIELKAQELIQRRIDVIISLYDFPAKVFDEIRQTIDEVQGIRNEVAALSCDWSFSPRTQLLRTTYLRPLTLCKSEFRLLWGSAEGHPDEDLQEAQDHAAIVTTNLISERVEAEQTWREIFPSLESESAAVRKSPGEANRDEAVALAGAGVIADSNSTMSTQMLLLQQLDSEMERREDKRHLEMAEFLLRSASGQDPWADAALER